MSTRFVIGLVSAVGALAGSPASFAQAAGDLTIAVGECIELESDDERLACFDRRVDAALADGSGARSDTDGSPANGSAAPSRGASPARAPALAEEAAQAGLPRPTQPQPAQILSRIAALDERLPNSYLITLENGQTWRQVRSERYSLRVGHHVRIYPTRWGNSYRLTAEESRGFIQVERVR